MEPQETYTFSRALSMMRYGGKKMAPDYHTPDDGYFYVKDNYIFMNCLSGDIIVDEIQSCDIMGSWVEVKDVSNGYVFT